MKFRALVTVLTIVIFILFFIVVKFSYDLKLSENSLSEKNVALEIKNDSLARQEREIDSLYKVNKKQLETLERATDSIYFRVARNTNTFRSYRNYVNNFGENGEYYHKALTNMNAYFPKEGYIQIQESNGRKYYTDYKETRGFPEKAIMIVGKPSVTKDNLIIMDQAMRVRRGLYRHPDYRGRDGVVGGVKVGQVVKLLEVLEYGDALWGRIAYGDN